MGYLAPDDEKHTATAEKLLDASIAARSKPSCRRLFWLSACLCWDPSIRRSALPCTNEFLAPASRWMLARFTSMPSTAMAKQRSLSSMIAPERSAAVLFRITANALQSVSCGTIRGRSTHRGWFRAESGCGNEDPSPKIAVVAGRLAGGPRRWFKSGRDRSARIKSQKPQPGKQKRIQNRRS